MCAWARRSLLGIDKALGEGSATPIFLKQQARSGDRVRAVVGAMLQG